MDAYKDFGVGLSDHKSVGVSPARAKRIAGAAVCLGNARDALSGFGRGDHLFGLTKGQFSMIDLAAAVLERTGPADVAVWTWCIADYEVQAVSAFIVGGSIRRFRMVLDWSGAQRATQLVADLQERFGVDCVRVSHTHAKIVTVTTDDGWSVTIRGSMNLNSNPRFEQFDISDDPAVTGVVHGLMGEMWERGKPLPVRKLTHRGASDLLGVGDLTVPLPAWAPSPDKRWF